MFSGHHAGLCICSVLKTSVQKYHTTINITVPTLINALPPPFCTSAYKFFSENLKRRDHSEDLRVDGVFGEIHLAQDRDQWRVL
jgi:hypothetical protein